MADGKEGLFVFTFTAGVIDTENGLHFFYGFFLGPAFCTKSRQLVARDDPLTAGVLIN
jgi:hypothetical protein